MNYFLTEEQEMLRELCAQIAREKFLPVREELDETGEFPRDIVKAIAASDIYGVYIPEEYGGFGGGVMEMCIATEEFSRVCGGIALAFSASALGAYPILLFGSDDQKKKYLPPIAEGSKLAAFALTEANAGSDAGAIETKAELDGGHYVLNGTKQWITGGGEADVYTVFVRTKKGAGIRGITALIVEKDTPGFTFGKKEDKMGIRASTTRELIFQDCRVPKENVIGREGMGFLVGMRTFDQSRPGVAAQALGIAQGAFDEAAKYARHREQFGQPIASFQGIQFMLADMATQIEAARCLVYQAARTIDAGARDVGKISAMAKLFASDVAMKVTTDAVQVLGGYGYMKEYPVEKMMRDAKITQIYEGTNQIQRVVIGSQVVKESAAKEKKE
ncbi:MAG: acyl-CoA dehydrogenase [Candidatus Eisenbacteria bacterium]|nr:acyl-CoA dehydrogenase [Candidatus Eisenbacteria bacterium]